MIVAAILLSAGIAAFIALVVVAKQRLASKRRYAYELAAELLEPDFEELTRAFQEVSEANAWNIILKPSTDEELRTQIRVARYLNRLELVCLAVRTNIVDENVLKTLIGDALVSRLGNAMPLIAMIRNDENDQGFFQHFEHIGSRWQQDPEVRETFIVWAIVREIFRI